MTRIKRPEGWGMAKMLLAVYAIMIPLAMGSLYLGMLVEAHGFGFWATFALSFWLGTDWAIQAFNKYVAA